jgi:glucose/arabinose dehydrogenase
MRDRIKPCLINKNMKNIRTVILLSLIVIGLSPRVTSAQNTNGNGEEVAGEKPADSLPLPGQPYENRPKFGKGQMPAFKGQTRIGAVVTKTPYKVDIITSKLNKPWGLAFIPDGRMLITEKRGSLRLVSQNGFVGNKIDGLPNKIFYGGDAGLLDIAIDPAFATNRNIYFTYVEEKGNGGTGLVVSSAKLSIDEEKLEQVKKIYQVNDSTGGGSAHYGSRLLFDKSGKLMVSISERMFVHTREKSQWLSSQMGKIIRINTDGTAATGNPKFSADSVNALPEIWAVGVRNPQGMAWNPLTGDLWEDEHGTQGGDEVNIIRPGNNYGWPLVAYGVEYTWKPIGNSITKKAGIEQPIYYWDPTVAPSGCTFYTGNAIPEWKNNMFIATLAGEHIIRLVIKNDKVVGEERLLLDHKQRMRNITMGPDGNLWVIFDTNSGKLIKISKKN